MTDFTCEEVIDISHKLVGADLRNINLSEAHLRWANLRDADLSMVRYNARTMWPEGFDPVAAGAVYVVDG